MNALHFDRLKHRLYQPIKIISSDSTEDTTGTVFDDLENTLMNLAAFRSQNSQSLVNKQSSVSAPLVNSGTGTGTGTGTSSSSLTSSGVINQRYQRISVIESWYERERRRTSEPIYGIDHRRQFVKNRQALPPSSFVPSNWRPFKTIRYEREIAQSPVIVCPVSTTANTSNTNNTNNNTNTHNNSSSYSNNNTNSSTISLAKLYYCVNVFYAPPPTYPPIQLFLQVGTIPDTSTSGFLHRLHFTNLIETENYLQNLRNLLLIENGNCNLKVITDISTTGTATNSGSSVVNPVLINSNNNGSGNAPSVQTVNPVVINTSQSGVIKKQTQTQTQAQAQAQVKVLVQPQSPVPSNNPNQTQHTQLQTQTQFQLTPHQILQLNQRSSKDSMSIPTFSTGSLNLGVSNNPVNSNNNTNGTVINNNTSQHINNNTSQPQQYFNPKSPPTQ